MRSSSVAIGAATVFVAASALVSLASDRDGPSRQAAFDWTLRGSDTPADFETPGMSAPGYTRTAKLRL